jgi:RNA polymerase sigma factor (sigma-70 family)
MNAGQELLFEEYQYLVPVTIKRLFPNTRQFANSKHLDEDDLTQYGMIGLWKGIRNFDHSKGTMKLRNYLINNIRWTIYRYIQKNEMNQSYYKYDHKDKNGDNPKIKLVSMSKPLDDEGGSDLYDIIGTDNINNFIPKDFDHALITNTEYDKLLKCIDKLKEKDKKLFQLKMNGLDCEQIAQIYGVKRQGIHVKIQRIQKQLKSLMEGVTA